MFGLLSFGLSNFLTLEYISLVEQPKSGLTIKMLNFLHLVKYLILLFGPNIELVGFNPKITSEPINFEIVIICFCLF